MKAKKNLTKPKQTKKWIFVIVFVAITTAIIFYKDELMDIWYEQTAKSVLYPELGIAIPLGYSIHGIDVSRYQENINWNLVKQMKIKEVKIDFVFVKATEGLNSVDKFYTRNWKKLKEKKIHRGAYLYFLPYCDGEWQAKNFIKTVSLQKGDLPPVVDVEEVKKVPPELLQKRLQDCLHILEKHYKIKPIIYSYVNFYEDYLGDDFNDYPLWAAHYFNNNKPRIQRNWQFWQHSDKGKVNGIEGDVDFNVFNGDSTAFLKMLIK